MSDLAIQTKTLIKNYGSVHALCSVDLEIRRGEILGFTLLFTLLAWLLFEWRDVRVSGTGGWKMPAWMAMNWWLSAARKQK
ncbi:MAG: hypothetical protein IMZ73_01250 [Chloroflexi bacterium]|nr:hypothetical protein [Chloroflexota bacterium]